MEETTKPYITSNGCDMYQMNAKLQQKKNNIRKSLNKMGIQPKKAENKFDNYKYFSEAQYKLLFTELFSLHGIELTSSTINVESFVGTDKQPQGRRVFVKFTLHDIDTGFSESSVCSGEGIDKGDKALYKALTGAIKYFLANTFMVATGEDAEADTEVRASKAQIAKLNKLVPLDMKTKVLTKYKVDSYSKLSADVASNMIDYYEELNESEEGVKQIEI